MAELLGFSQLEFIQELLEHRESIVEAVLHDATDLLHAGEARAWLEIVV